MKILWIDDHIYGTLAPTVDYLASHGVEVATAKNFSEALAQLRLNTPDGIVLDVVFPDDSGLDLLGEIKHLYPGLPVILCTSTPKLKDQLKSMVDQGAAFYIDKAMTVPPLNIGERNDFIDVMSDLFACEEANTEKLQSSGWLHRRDSKTSIVFLHGFFSNNVDCWTSNKEGAETYWPDLVSLDPSFSNCSIYLSGFYTGPDSGTYSTRDAARDVFAGLRREQAEQGSLLNTCENIIFVCHSTGGIVARHMLVNNHPAFADKRIGLVLLASPSYGSIYANMLGLIARLYRNRLALELKRGGIFLRELDAGFKDLIKDDKIPKLCGIEAIESKPIFSLRWLPFLFPKVVDGEAGGRYFGNSVQVAETDHFSIVKPVSVDHGSHQLLSDFFKDHFQDN